jgi:hypothetical protein
MTRPDCADCGRLLDVLTAAVRERGELDVLSEWEDLRGHLADEHAAELPPYTAGCWNCDEWKRTHRGRVSESLRPLLEREARLHRAGHRLALVDELDEPSGMLRIVAVIAPVAELAPEWTRVLCEINGAGRCQAPGCACGSIVFTCPTCGRTSHHPEDARHGWCSACQAFTGDPRGLGLGPT